MARRTAKAGAAARPAPAGRLDIDSIGLLVLTQDGRVARQLLGENAGTDTGGSTRTEFAWQMPTPVTVFGPAVAGDRGPSCRFFYNGMFSDAPNELPGRH